MSSHVAHGEHVGAPEVDDAVAVAVRRIGMGDHHALAVEEVQFLVRPA
jgi:hypothetical protein